MKRHSAAGLVPYLNRRAKLDMMLDVITIDGDTRHLTATQVGVVNRLMWAQWRRKELTLPHDDRVLAQLAGVRLQDWMRHHKPVVFSMFDDTPVGLSHPLVERAGQLAFNAMKSGKAK